jgi:DNA invertase Pin-like site-specific DNA recombinase
VKAGLRNARSKGKTLGRPRRIVDEAKIASLRSQGASWRSISDDLGIGIATLYRASARRSENPSAGLAAIG